MFQAVWTRVIFLLVSLAIGPALAGPESAYKTSAGPNEVRVASLELPFPALDKDLPLRIAFPESGGPYPVIVFSHGNGSSKDDYSAYSDHWASHGYVVIQPTHMDSTSLGFSMRNMNYEKMMAISDSRRRDMRHIVDSLAELERRIDGLTGKMDSERLVAAGHSMGGATALRLAGLVYVDPQDGSEVDYGDDRFDALLLVSDPGNNRLMPDAPWQAVAIPTFIATGTNDYGGMPKKPGRNATKQAKFAKDWAMPDTANHYLFVDGMDHYLGGLICKEDVPGPKDFEALRIIDGVSTAFLDAYMKQDEAAMAFLQGGQVAELTGGRATLELR
jgi:dienelactone hydrolase